MKYFRHKIFAIYGSMCMMSFSIRSQFVSILSVAAALLEDLIGYEEIQQPILMGLVGMLKATEDGPLGTAPSATSVPNPLLGRYTPIIVIQSNLDMNYLTKKLIFFEVGGILLTYRAQRQCCLRLVTC